MNNITQDSIDLLLYLLRESESDADKEVSQRLRRTFSSEASEVNIFATSDCPEESAKYLDNKRLIKMVLETAQLLSTAMVECSGKSSEELGVYRPTHRNHPSAKWVRETQSNYIWTLNHFLALSLEYSKRFDKVHKSTELVPMLADGIALIPEGGRTPFAIAIGSFEPSNPDAHPTQIYREYLASKWEADLRKGGVVLWG